MNKKRMISIIAAVVAALMVVPLLLACLAGTAFATPRILKKGCMGEDVRALQGTLEDLGYMTVSPTGVFGSITRTAVINFQKDKGLTADGVVGSNTYAALNAAAGGSTPQPAQTPEPAAAALTLTRTLRRGTSGTDVRAVQNALNALGYSVGTADGIFGTKTTQAVKRFQAAYGILADGIVGSVTAGKLNAALANLAGNATPAPEATPTAETTPAPESTLAPEATPAPTIVKQSELVGPDGYRYYSQQITASLKRGNSGYNVKDLQQALKTMGYYSGSVDGLFGNGTYDAVRRFQSAMRLDVDGIAGNYTLSALYTSIHTTAYASIDRVSYPVDLTIPLTKPNWSDASTLFPKQSIAIIVDIRTGKTFQVKRTGGTSHADCELVSYNDVATMHDCYGNWSWNRRPIWVIVNGQRMAASMNGMPHGYDSISDNGMRGQFCIHFVDSRTHGSNKVDPEHQACIEEAYNATSVPGILG